MIISIVQFIVKLFDAINRIVTKGLAWAIYPLIVIVVIEVVARYLFAVPVIWARDVSLWLYMLPFMLSAAHYYHRKKHIAAEDLLYATRMSPRIQALIDVVHYLFLLSVAILVLEPAIRQMQLSIRFREASTITIWRPLLWPVRAIIPITLVMLILQGVSGLGHAFVTIFSSRDDHK
ncbi:TRAP transporter small permease subunit [Candidatus Acetothermia bacterium]|jgi:TRAP-type mannitol/chloroaromatic compound transport system permease small subunit|nr:TRAP transporter small permease subunit [Candidatus Acetothermia bacterium]MCI2427442.1 TRAP transporter small permease subunit [Candidatus Acetothermia bacterium]MCI2428513.1 TRAP transporter small permease subunit [Candidatus Acetothermia bacterium]